MEPARAPRLLQHNHPTGPHRFEVIAGRLSCYHCRMLLSEVTERGAFTCNSIEHCFDCSMAARGFGAHCAKHQIVVWL